MPEKELLWFMRPYSSISKHVFVTELLVHTFVKMGAVVQCGNFEVLTSSSCVNFQQGVRISTKHAFCLQPHLFFNLMI